MPLIKTQLNTSILEPNKVVYSIINKLENGDYFYLPPNHKIITNKDSENPEIIDGDCNLVYEQDGRIKNLYIVKLSGLQERCIISKEIDGYLFYCALFVTWKGVDPLKFFNIPEDIATDDGLYEYVKDIIDKSAYEAFRPEASEEDFKKLLTKKANKYFEEYGIVIDGDIYIDGYMCEKNTDSSDNTKKEDDDSNLFLDTEKDPEPDQKVIIQNLIKCKKCGYIPEGKVPKFCPECGTKFEI